MPPSASRNPARDPNQEALVVVGFISVASVLAVFYLAYARLHIYRSQILELTIYLTVACIMLWEVVRFVATYAREKEENWPHPKLYIERRRDHQELARAHAKNSIVIGYDIHGKAWLWPDETRVMQANAFGMTGAGKSTLLSNIISQDLSRTTGPKGHGQKIPLIIVDGKGDNSFLDEFLIPEVAAAGRLQDLLIISPSRPEISVRFNPFVSLAQNYQDHVNFIFESFDLKTDFFHGHQKTYLSDVVRILYYTGKRYNIYDILVMIYDLAVLKEQAATAHRRLETLHGVSKQQKLNFEMSVRNLVESFSDPKRVQMVRGLINNMMTFLEDRLSIITGPYEDLVSIEEIIDQGKILCVSLNTSANDETTTALGRMILQNLQMVIGARYERNSHDVYMPFLSVIMDEFAPIAYYNFATILQTARGSNTAFVFSMQSVPQLLDVGRGFQRNVASAPNTTFMMLTRDEDTCQHFLKGSARVKQIRRSRSVRRTGVFNPKYRDEGTGSETETLDTRAREEQIKNMPVGQMQVLMSDRELGTIHDHVHVRSPYYDQLRSVKPIVFPRYTMRYNTEIGANLRFSDVTLEAKRQRGMRTSRRSS
jgi:type IV secretory pathway TraG/TraD family ATPase VirD4